MPAKCTDLCTWNCQSNQHLPLEHLGSVELDLSALFSINRAFFASSGANVRALWTCAKGFGACWCVLWLLRCGDAMREMAQNGGEEPLETEGA